MCDIYMGECKKCGTDLPMHLGDYDTGRDEVECFCSNHLPRKNVRIFTLIEDDIYEDEPYIPKTLLHSKGWRMGIRALTKNARLNADKNHPNCSADFNIEIR